MLRFTPLLSAVLAILLAVPAVLDPGPDALAKKNGKIRTRTFANSAFITISAGGANGASDYPSEIRVRGFKKGKVRDVNLQLFAYTHGNPDDVDIMLVAPNGRNAIVLADAGGDTNPNFVDLMLDDEAMGPPPDSATLSSGKFHPVNYAGADPFVGAPPPSGAVQLATFDGAKANGIWRLFVFDDTADEGGSIGQGWSLTITAKIKKRRK